MTSAADSQRDTSVRNIARRLVVRGTLELTAPAHFGGGVESDLADMALLRDAADGGLLLPGTSIAGALRSYLRAYEQGHRGEERQSGGLAELLLGGQKGDPDGEQSPLLIADSLAEPTPIEVRDGVAIDSRTRTARDQKKFNLELVPAGTRFPLELELLLPDDEGEAARLRTALSLALGALQHGEITVGARGSRGYGACRAHGWSLTTYDLDNTDHLLAYLVADRCAQEDDPKHTEWQRYAVVTTKRDDDIVALPGTAVPAADQRKTVTLTTRFTLASPLLIRSDLPEYAGEAPDATHLRRPNGTGREPVLPGTSVAGALRARAVRIANTLGAPNLDAIEGLFGPEQGREVGKRPLKASRLRVSEQAISDSNSLVQSRVSIDRFTGGALDTALFSEAPLIKGDVELTITIHDPEDAELGLLMLLLKDLWTGDLPLGGTSSIGRGRLQGIGADLSFSPEALPAALKPAADSTPQLEWPIGAEKRLTVAPQLATYLETCVQAIPGWLRQEKKDG
jgi:CRISPR/Cas system CSM-associated protein Csm3 (group 7 of RAMP superfamily)